MKTPPRRLLLPLGLAAASLVLWDTFVVYPFRLFVVFLHEISHGLAAVATGGRIVSIGLSFDEGGVCLTRGGWPFLILNAGYLGSLLWGALFLLLGGRRTRARSVVARRRRLHAGGHARVRPHRGSASSTASPPASSSWPSPRA